MLQKRLSPSSVLSYQAHPVTYLLQNADCNTKMSFSSISTNINDTLFNSTMESQPNNRDNLKIVSYFVIGFLACASNFLLCLVLGRSRLMLQKPYNIIILTLGVCDLLTGQLTLNLSYNNLNNITIYIV